MMTIVVIANYSRDHQESMNKFARMLQRGYYSNGVKVIKFRPPVFFGIFWHKTTSGIGKWMSYLDKWILAPIILLFIRIQFIFKQELFFHIADHSNAPYLFWLPKSKTLITCHDVLAIRGALGDKDARCNASFTGKLLQIWILKNLLRARNVGAVSQTTLSQLQELARHFKKTIHNREVIYNGLNASFYPMQEEYVISHLKRAGIDTEKPYLLHVGSSLPRKNRLMLLKMLLLLGDDFKGNIIYAGRPLDSECLNFINEHQLQERVEVIIDPAHQLLLALYSCCEAFIFPSWSEGFGWPVVEAQACGAPVIASNIMPMPEIAGDGALFASPASTTDFVNAYYQLKDPGKKESLIKAGFLNLERFSTAEMIKSYMQNFKRSN
jgi:glycosyltransferase involved in cell wall biosynthesis